MLELKALLLCDAASTRDSLLNVLGGGLTMFGRSSFPAPFNADVALTLEASPDAPIGPYSVRVEGAHLDSSERLFEAEYELRFAADDAPSYRTASFAIALRDAGIPIPGSYEIRVAVDGKSLGSMHFTAFVQQPDA